MSGREKRGGKAGGSFFFFPQQPTHPLPHPSFNRTDGERDYASLHGSCPVLAGDKWSATKWIHVTNFYQSGGGAGDASPDGCADASEHCGAWADAGECKKNPGYMLVSCRKACGACPPPVPEAKSA